MPDELKSGFTACAALLAGLVALLYGLGAGNLYLLATAGLVLLLTWALLAGGRSRFK